MKHQMKKRKEAKLYLALSLEQIKNLYYENRNFIILSYFVFYFLLDILIYKTVYVFGKKKNLK